MRQLLPIAALAGGIVFASAGMAENFYGKQFDTGGTTSAEASRGVNMPMVVDVDDGTVRQSPDVQAKILTELPRGYEVTVIGTANGGGWAHVYADGLDGYMDMVQLERIPAGYYPYSQPQAYGRPMIVISDEGNLHARPTPQSPLIETLPQGSQVVVLDNANAARWAHVSANGVDGYMDFVQLGDSYPAHSQTIYPTYNQTTYPTYNQTIYPTYNQTTYPTYQGGYQGSQPNEMTVTQAGGAIYQTADPESPLLATLPPGYRVVVIGSAGSWAHVSTANGIDGYMDYRQLQ
jgi:Bacterial SH3 domain